MSVQVNRWIRRVGWGRLRSRHGAAAVLVQHLYDL